MVEGVDSAWNLTDGTDEVMNLVTVGQGTVFPAEWPVNRLFLRTDQNKIYKNDGTLLTPIFIGISGDPPGTIIMFAGIINKIPAGWLLCDGSSQLQAAYPGLYDVIGLLYGSGASNDTFSLPDFATDSRFPRAAVNDGALTNTGGESEHQLTVAELASHIHFIENQPTIPTQNAIPTNDAQGNAGTTTPFNTGSTGSNTPHENKPPFLDIHFIIAT